MIPKIIHYCWFGGNPLPPLAKKCLRSWKKYCPEYQIKKWSEENFNIESAPTYVRQAYEAKKWAFVTDYVRLYALVKYGGIYMDTDVEVLKKLDKFLCHKAFSGFEDGIHIPTGIMACEKGFPLFNEFLSFYDTANFYNQEGKPAYVTNVTIITDICLSKGFQGNNKYQEIEGFALYPRDVFCPVSYHTGLLEKTKNTVTIHWFAGSWHNQEQRKQRVERMKKARTEHIRRAPFRFFRYLLGNRMYEGIRKTIKGIRK